ncbi:MAG: hypothetical protein LBT89_02545, partial [Planctomycetaceae bacterium]|nr:hypothetical protein [Planctomycetaceae bacterium]
LHKVQNIDEVTVNVPGFIGSSAGQGEFYQGKLDDLRFYSRALSPGEIQAEFAKVRPAQTLVDKSLEAQKLYKKSETFTQIYQPDGNGPKEPKSQALQFKDTLTFTSTNVFNFLNNGVRTDSKDCNGNPIPPKYASWDAAKAALMPNALLVQLHRLIREDFPAETNDYLVRFNMSPVEIMTWSEDAQKKRINELRDAFTEYMPLTENQWQVLSAKDKGKWRAAQSMLEGLDDKGVNFNLYEVLFIMMREIHARPQVSERVAPYRKAETPAVKDRSGEEAKQIIEAEWLFQCGGKPSLERILQEIQWTKALAERFVKQAPGLRFDAEMKQLDEIEAKTANANWTDKELYFAVRRIKRSIAFKNPVIDFDSIVYVDGPMPDGNESRHETRHRLGYMAVPGGRLMTLKGLHPGGHQTKLMPQEPLHGSFWRPDLSYDGKRVLVGFKPHNEKNFHIYEVKVDGSMERQLTSGIFDDFDPIYLPDGKNIMFLTSRGHIYVRCMPPTNAFVLARMSLDTQPGDKNLYIISRNGEPEYTPSVMNDGRVIYTRWEYTDKPLWRAQSLWTMNSDGTQVQTFWGNQSVWPDLLKDARSIPGSERVMFTGAGHHNWFGGSIGIIDPGKGFNFPDGLTKVTQELVWVESGNGAIDPKESNTYHTAGNYGAYYSPYPLSEKDFLVSAERQMSDKDGKPLPSKWVLLLMDTDGNRELVFEGDKHIFDAQPIRSRNVPQVAADRVDWPDWDSRDTPKTGVIYSNNVYENAPAELRGKAKYLRIWSIEHKTYTYWSKRNYVSSGPEISPVQSEGVKKIIGTVPVEEDGSVSFTAPSGIALHFQLLDKNQLALQTMKSFTGVLPGETRGCLGCHESMTRSPVTAQTGKALKRPRSNITPVPWEDITVGYERYVQPVLDKHCGQCHQNPEHKAYQKFNATLRPGFLGFKEPYMTLVGNPTWGRKYEERKDAQGGFGWADIIMVEGYGTHDPAAYATYPPMKKLSYKSRLVHRLMSGEHNNVKVSGDELLRVILWVDAMAPYYGAEEVRCMEDPLFQGKDW